MPEQDRSIIISRRIILTDDQRIQYTEAIMPYVLAAREAYQPILDTKRQLKALDEQEGEIEAQLRENRGNPIEEPHPLSDAFTGIRLSRQEMEHSPLLDEAREEFRLRANELIAEVNRWKAEAAVAGNLVSPGATALVGNPQIPPAERKNKFRQTDSPVRPHNALGTLSIYREKHVRTDLSGAIRANSRVLGQHEEAAEVSLAMVHLVPEHFVAMNRFTPADVRRPGDLGKHIVEISHTVGIYDAGLLQPPTAEELGLPSTEQEDHITTHLRALLAHFLRDELANPNRTERQLQDLYRDLSDYVRRTAKHITPQMGNISSSYERIGLIIECLPGIEGPMLAARFSTNLYQDLGLPCLDYIGETRLAEVTRNIASSTHFVPGNYRDMTPGGYKIPYSQRLLLVKIIDSITERLGNGEIDCQKLFGAIESLDYGERVIENLFEVADDEQQGILLRALRETACFDDVLKDLFRKRYARGYDLDEE